jgi:hypothetical protein
VHASQFGSQVRKPFRLTLRIAVLKGDILAFDPAEVAQTGFKSLDEG